MRRVRRWLLSGLLLCSALMLSGCTLGGAVEDLFTLPQTPVRLEGLSDQLEDMLSRGYEYSSPTGGTNMQALQMVDLDHNGTEEAVVFLRHDGDAKPMKVIVFRSGSTGYEVFFSTQSSGSSIDSVLYEDLTGDGIAELIVGWKIGTDVQNLAVYDVKEDGSQLMSSGYVRFLTADLQGNGQTSLLVLQPTSEGMSEITAYTWKQDMLSPSHSAELSSTVAELRRGSVEMGMWQKDVPALFVTGINDEGIAATDVLAAEPDGSLFNALLEDDTGRTVATYDFVGVAPQDMDSDGIWEIPTAQTDAEDGIIQWYHYLGNGRKQQQAETLYCQSTGWYLTVPKAWWGRLSTTAQGDNNEYETTLLVDGEPALSVYAITGEDRESRAVMEGRFVVRRLTDTVFAARLYDRGYALRMDEDTLRHNFSLVDGSWKS